MNNIFYIALGGGLGTVLRYTLSLVIHKNIVTHFPLGTFCVNALGCLLIGMISVKFSQLTGVNKELRNFIMVGFLGGFTTFSSFSLETMDLFKSGYSLYALLNIFFTVFICLSFTFLGFIIGEN